MPASDSFLATRQRDHDLKRQRYCEAHPTFVSPARCDGAASAARPKKKKRQAVATAAVAEGLLARWMVPGRGGRSSTSVLLQTARVGCDSTKDFEVVGWNDDQTVAVGPAGFRVLPTSKLPCSTADALAAATTGARGGAEARTHFAAEHFCAGFTFCRTTGSQKAVAVHYICDGPLQGRACNAEMRAFLIKKTSWSYSSEKYVHFVIDSGDIKQLPPVPGNSGEGPQCIQYDYLGRQKAIDLERVHKIMREPRTKLPHLPSSARIQSRPNFLATLQHFVDPTGSGTVQVATAEQDGAVGAQTPAERRAALSLKALGLTGADIRPNTGAGRVELPQFVLCNGQTVPGGRQRTSWAKAKVCRCGLVRQHWCANTGEQGAPTLARFRKNCGNDGKTAVEKRRVAAAKANDI